MIRIKEVPKVHKELEVGPGVKCVSCDRDINPLTAVKHKHKSGFIVILCEECGKDIKR